MLLIRDVFHCKPGKAKLLVEKFKQTTPSLHQDDNFRNFRIMVDYVAKYWTVVLQAEVDDLSVFEKHMNEFSTRPEVRKALDGYMDLVEGGFREIYKIV